MDFNVDWFKLGSIFAAIIALLSYGIKKYIDVKLNFMANSRVDILKKHYEKYYESLWNVQKFLSEISHCIEHIKKGHNDYTSKCKELCMELRRRTREDIAVLGRNFVNEILEATDTIIDYTNKQTEALMLESEKSISDLNDETEQKRKNIFQSNVKSKL